MPAVQLSLHNPLRRGRRARRTATITMAAYYQGSSQSSLFNPVHLLCRAFDSASTSFEPQRIASYPSDAGRPRTRGAEFSDKASFVQVVALCHELGSRFRGESTRRSAASTLGIESARHVVKCVSVSSCLGASFFVDITSSTERERATTVAPLRWSGAPAL